MSTAVELLDQGHEVDIYESRQFIGGKVRSFVDKHGNHIEMGLHVFFGCYNNLFLLMRKYNEAYRGRTYNDAEIKEVRVVSSIKIEFRSEILLSNLFVMMRLGMYK